MKSEFRQKAKIIRQNVIYNDIKTNSILKNLLSTPEYQASEVIFSYMNIKTEVSTLEINQKILADKKSLALPKVYGELMKFHKILDLKNDTIEGAFKILEPKINLDILNNFDIILVPALAFSKKGYRLGYGAGFYDKYLQNKKGIFIGICFDEQIFDEIPRDKFDIQMDLLITPTKIINCKEI
ncbi:MAG: 5-formyltetrahydrofolate cyclo-ligase [Clostridia bacterium]